MTSPVILIGMHRSGTTLLAGMLRQMGLFVGWALDANIEAAFFAARNDFMLRSQGATWDRPLGVDALLERADLRVQVLRELRRDMQSLRAASFLGPSGYLRYRSLFRLDFPWGWKDPRNTFLLPLWLDIFPQAKVVHVVRNGVDVALSLAKRESMRLEQILGGHQNHRLKRWRSALPSNVSRLGWLWAQLGRRAAECGSRKRYFRFRAPTCLELERGFGLWERYVERAISAGRLVGANFLQVRLEDLILDPTPEIARLADHCNVETSNDRVRSLANILNPDVRFRFLRDTRGLELYRRVRSTPLMENLGYHFCEESA